MAADLAAVKSSISCTDAFNSVAYCASPGHQLSRYYKDGALDSCDAPIGEFKLCVRLKLAGAAEARDIVQQLLRKGREPAPTMGTVWEPRKAGSW